MSLRSLLLTICQNQRKLLPVYQILNGYGFRSVSLSTTRCCHKKESPTLVGNAEPSPENLKVLHKKQTQEDYDYYKKFIGTVKEIDKETPPELKAMEVIERKCHSSLRTNLIPETVNKDDPTAFPVQDLCPETKSLHAFPDIVQSNAMEKYPNSISNEKSSTLKDSRLISKPFLQDNKMSPSQNTFDLMQPSDYEETMIESTRRRYTEIASSYNLAVYVNESETLKQLVSLGVDLSAIEKIKNAANLILKLDFESDVKPYFLFLKDIGIPDDKLATIITKNPLIFSVTIEDLHTIIDYIKSKNFSETAIPQIIIRAPRLLLMPVSNIDGKLGFYQKLFQLTGNEVREVISHLPKLITYDAKAIKEIHFQMKEFLGFTNSDLQKIFLITPRVFLSNKYKLTSIFDYVHNEMGLSHAQLIQWPKIFRTRLHRIKERHEFLKQLKRHQYDTTKENYISLKALVSQDDNTFCLDVAKTSTVEFNQFLKTL